jgi:hypothetical protein
MLVHMTDTMTWNVFNGRDAGRLGWIPEFFSEGDPRPAAAQLNENYAHGGGWRPFEGFVLTSRGDDGVQLPVAEWRLQYPGDPAYAPVAFAYMRDEVLVLFPYGWLLIMQPDGKWKVSRVD